jgi:hypothetical protein
LQLGNFRDIGSRGDSKYIGTVREVTVEKRVVPGRELGEH